MHVQKKTYKQLLFIAVVMTLLSLNLYIIESSPEQKLYNDTFDKLERFNYIINRPVLANIMTTEQYNAIQAENTALRVQFFIDAESNESKNLKLEQLQHIHKEVSVFYSLKLSEINKVLDQYYESTYNVIQELELDQNSKNSIEKQIIRQKAELVSYNRFRDMTINQKLDAALEIYELHEQVKLLEKGATPKKST